MMSSEFELEMEGMGELEGEFEWELEGEYEDEYEGEEFLGSIISGLGSLLGQGEYEDENEGELEYELEGEYESEEFLRRIARGVGSFVRRAAPVLKNVARVAAPIVGTAVGGPLGGIIGGIASSALGEGEFEHELEGEFEYELEGEFEDEYEATPPLNPQTAQAELMAAVASRAQTDMEAEAMAGAATVYAISPADRAALRAILPHLVRGTAILTRVLRRRRVTRPAIRTVPTIVQRTTRVLVNRAAAGQPVTRRVAARVMSAQTRRVLSSPRASTQAITRNVRGARVAARSAARTNAQNARRAAARGGPRASARAVRPAVRRPV
jgi:hypothetical protein